MPRPRTLFNAWGKAKKQGISAQWGKLRNGKTMIYIKYKKPRASLKRSRSMRMRPEGLPISKQAAKANPIDIFHKAKKSDIKNNGGWNNVYSYSGLGRTPKRSR